MRVLVAAYVLLSLTAVFISVFRPYGAPELELLGWWPAVSALAGSSIALVCWTKDSSKLFIPIGVAFFVSASTASMISSRNDLFIAEVTGVMTSRYVGGHGLKALEVREPDGELFRIEGIPPLRWENFSAGDSVVKERGSYHITVAGRTVELDRYGKVWSAKQPIQGEVGASNP